MRGLTLIEILLVIGISVFLLSVSLSFGFDFYKSQQLGVQSETLLQVLRRAQSKAIFQEGDSAFGVYFSGNSYTLFKGGSFLTRDSQYDEPFTLPSIINLSGLPEVVFSKLEGKPNITGDIILTDGNLNLIININGVGRINLE